MILNSMPVFPNWFPFNNMVLDGQMSVGPYEGVKTRSWEWDYRGPVLFYNSGRTAKLAVEAYGYTNSPSQHHIIIGAGELVEVRNLTVKEAEQMVCNFNNITSKKVREVLQIGFGKFTKLKELSEERYKNCLLNFFDFGPYIAPYPIGFFFRNLKRFKEPVPFKWPAGPVKPINTKIVSGSKLHKQLELSGF